MKSLTRKGKLSGASRPSQANASTTYKKEIEERRLRKLKVYLRSVSYNGCEGLLDFPSLTDLYHDTILPNAFPCDTMNQPRRYSCAPTAFLVACCFNRGLPATTRRRTGNFRARSSVKRNIEKPAKKPEIVTNIGPSLLRRPNGVLTDDQQDRARITGKPNDKISFEMAPNNDGRKNVNSDCVHTETASNQGQNREFSAKICDKSTMVVGCAKEAPNTKSKTKLKRSDRLTEISIFQLDKTDLGQTDLEIREENTERAEKCEFPKRTTSADLKQVGGSFEKTEISILVETSQNVLKSTNLKASRKTDVEGNLEKRENDNHSNTSLKLESVVTGKSSSAAVIGKSCESCHSIERKGQIAVLTKEMEQETESSRHQETPVKSENNMEVQRDTEENGDALLNQHLDDETEISSDYQLSDNFCNENSKIHNSRPTSCKRRSLRVEMVIKRATNGNQGKESEKNGVHRSDWKYADKKCPKKAVESANISLCTRAMIKQPSH